ncbi:hypothetical protein CHS0354_027122 [Potamilus streckersoni]|uniref:Uncharacterized protein n=1 Tax=Potamilus streckersoni TaxID=2493646 RepID=A0AAE0S0S3_9BIVA|nr:hypothetical protein CHS0354_027122 [Potamilus streckersoni]
MARANVKITRTTTINKSEQNPKLGLLQEQTTRPQLCRARQTITTKPVNGTKSEPMKRQCRHRVSPDKQNIICSRDQEGAIVGPTRLDCRNLENTSPRS